MNISRLGVMHTLTVVLRTAIVLAFAPGRYTHARTNYGTGGWTLCDLFADPRLPQRSDTTACRCSSIDRRRITFLPRFICTIVYATHWVVALRMDMFSFRRRCTRARSFTFRLLVLVR